jgi:DNA-binding beta-propeller fold protein YncE
MANAVSDESRPDAAGMIEVEHWAELPQGISFEGDAAAVAVGHDDQIYVFNRGAQRIVIFDDNGNYVDGWGTAAQYVRPHGMVCCADGDLILVDAGSHVVDRVTVDGKLVMRIGIDGVASRAYSGDPFNQPTDVAEHPITGDLFVSDGYGNASIHRFDADGRHVLSWGGPGTEPGRLSNPHGLCFVGDDHLAVCDRENYRIQIFDLNGTLEDVWHWHHPCAIRSGPDGTLFVAELGPPTYMHGVIPDMGCCISMARPNGEIFGRLGTALPDMCTGSFLAPHGLAVSPKGDVYVAEVNRVYLEGLHLPVPDGELICFRKWSLQ